MFSFFCDHENSLLNFPIALCSVYFHFNLYSMLERSPSLLTFISPRKVKLSLSPCFYPPLSLSLSRFFKGSFNTGVCSFNSLITNISIFSLLIFPSPPPRFLFNVQGLFLPLHTLINEFFHLPSFPALAYFSVSSSPPYFHPRKSQLLL